MTGVIAVANDIDQIKFESLVALRIVVGYLGEREQYAWWSSSFFAAGSKAFLTPVFGRTHVLAQSTGVTRAASLVHDERIGFGNVYHLFRLPEDLEQAIHRALHDSDMGARVGALVANQATALDYLRTTAGPYTGAGIGPTRVGDTHELRQDALWSIVAANYSHAFESLSQIYPYFSETPL
jgi:hypothetical protein